MRILRKIMSTRGRLKRAAESLAEEPTARNYVALAREYTALGLPEEVERVCHEGLALHPEDGELQRLSDRAHHLVLEDRIQMLQAELDAGRLRFTSRGTRALARARVVFICVGTPMGENGQADLRAMEAAASRIARDASDGVLIVEKSTVPAGTADRVRGVIGLEAPNLEFDVASNPEFLREGHALEDALVPDRIVVGVSSRFAASILRRVYDPLTSNGTLLIETDVRTAELAKHASNAFLAMKISYANALARLSEHDRSSLAEGGLVREQHLRVDASAVRELDLAAAEHAGREFVRGADESLRVGHALHSLMVDRRRGGSPPGNPQNRARARSPTVERCSWVDATSRPASTDSSVLR